MVQSSNIYTQDLYLMFRLVLVIFTPVPDNCQPLYLRCNASNESVVYHFI